MPRIQQEWTVLPHGRLTEIDDGILTVTGEIHMPLTPLQRRMTVVRLRDRRLVIFSAIALDEPQMAQIEAFGTPAFLVVPGDHHRTDAKVWKARYPGLNVVTPPAARTPVEEAVPVDACEADFGDPDVKLLTVPGTQGHDAALVVHRPSGTTLVVNDIIGNMDKESGLVLRLMGFAGDHPHIPLPVRPSAEHKTELRHQLLEWAALPDLQRIIMSHGEPIERGPAGELRRLADSLA